MSYRGALTGKNFESETERDHFERIEAMKRRVPTEEEKAFENLPADKIKELFNRALQSEEEKAGLAITQQNSETWLKLHPEFVDNIDNALQLRHWLQSHEIKAARLSDFEAGYNELKQAGLLKLNARILAEQEDERHRNRAKKVLKGGGIRPSLPSEDELQQLPLEEIRRRAFAEMQEPEF